MKTNIIIRFLAIVSLAVAFVACKSTDKDIAMPEILPVGEATAPLNCQQYPRGGAIFFDYLFTDDKELGAYNIEIHNDFDHHTHSTEEGECEHEHEHETETEPVNPWILNKDYPIPAGSTSYEAKLTIPVPTDVDPGEYHFMIRLTDRSGWQQIKSVSIIVI